MPITRRQFLHYGIATLAVGTTMPWLLGNKVYAAVPVQELDFTITDAMKEMVTHNSINDARCYFWIYKSNTPDLPADCPGPIIFTTEQDQIRIKVTNALDEPHAFAIPGVFDSGPIAPGHDATFTFVAPKAGTYLYFDNLNAPVNRVMGLHGALIVMPRRRVKGHKFTPYSKPTPAVQQLFDDFGSAHFPGLSWEQADPGTLTPGFRQYVWLVHQASPVLFAEVGNFAAGQDYPAAQFVDLFMNDPYANTFNTGNFNRKPHFFTINGQSGFYGHHNPFISPFSRVGEPVVIRCLNAGLHQHSLHIHANHVFLTGDNNIVQDNPLWIDTMTLHPLDTYEWAVPYQRPPDIPNVRGIGLPDPPLLSIANPAIQGSTPHPVWPPEEEMNMFFPPVGTETATGVNLAVQLSPLEYPMHDHTETSQTAQGGNYNCGMIAGITFTGDRTTPGAMDFPNSPVGHNSHGLRGTSEPAPHIDDLP